MARTTAFQADDSNSSESERRMRTGGNFIESAQLYENSLKYRNTASSLRNFYFNLLEKIYFRYNPFTAIITF